MSKEGFLDVDLENEVKRIGITRVHMEEDAGKLIHREDVSWVDFNRTGIPLLEIVSEPDLSSPFEAYEYLAMLKSTIQYLDVSDCDMEKGSLRCDANISLRKKGAKELGVKTELKNMNSFKAVKEALSFEIKRQNALLNDGKGIIQETRLWDPDTQETVSMRTKEGAQDYRYFPEPDLPPFIISKEKIEAIKREIPELPKQKLQRFIKEYALNSYDAKIIVALKKDADFAEGCFKLYKDVDKKIVVNWLNGPILSEANARNSAIYELKVTQEDLIELIGFVERDEISNLSAKAVLTEMVNSGKKAEGVIKEKNLIQISDSGALNTIIEEVIKENDKSVNDFKSGKEAALMFLVGQAMKKSSGKANPKALKDFIKRRLKDA